ncbi:MAG TPA: serine hydrolase domain-containing protein [Gemmatimonadales bacterium]|nr:serine hydrolase domain-containing protein [Gemmatimonadales bacterium]
MIRRCSLALLMAVAACAPSRSAAPAATAAPVATPAQDSAAALIEATLQRTGIPGAQVAVMRDGALLWSRGFGMADLEQQVPVTNLTRFRIGSVSKSLAAGGLLVLLAEGRVDLDADVRRYVPEFPAKPWPVTVRQVAGHTGGIRHYRHPGEFMSTTRYGSVVEALAPFSADSLLFEPGTRYSYSTFGFTVVSAVMERAAGQPFLAFMQQRVFDPLAMTHTSADFSDSIVTHRARFYSRADSTRPRVNTAAVDNSIKWAGGGYVSTSEDIARFADGVMAGRLVADSLVRLAWTPQRLRDGSATSYGLGFFVAADSLGRRLVSHGGGAAGSRAQMLLYPDERLVVVMLWNADFGGMPANRVADFFRGGR